MKGISPDRNRNNISLSHMTPQMKEADSMSKHSDPSKSSMRRNVAKEVCPINPNYKLLKHLGIVDK